MIENQYPIGKFNYIDDPDQKERERLISNIERLPSDLRMNVTGLSNEQLDTPYRVGGWTVRQVIHHLADSHLNSFIRFKWTLTENNPTIKDYNQDRWAETADAQIAPPELSLSILVSIHRRWAYLLKSLSEVDFEKSFNHPESGEMSLNKSLVLYDWHGRHHLAQIKTLKKIKRW